MKVACVNPFVTDYTTILRRLAPNTWYQYSQLRMKKTNSLDYLLRHGLMRKWRRKYALTESGHKFSMTLRSIFGDENVETY